MKRNLSILGLGFIAVAALLIAWPALFGAPAGSPVPLGPTGQATIRTDKVAAQAYPPPGSPAAPTSTPPADPDGYLPPPSFLPSQVVGLASSPYSDLLVPLQAALSSGDAAWPAAMVSERFGNTLFDIANLDSEGGAQLTAEESRAVLADFARQGSRPLIQGYFVGGGNLPCVTVLAHRFTGAVPYPGTFDGYGPPLPSEIPPDAAGWMLCQEAPGAWIWMSWVYGGYYDIARRYAAARDWDYFVVRP